MARRLRLEYEGAIYHVTVRSNTGDDLFRDDRDRAYWLYRVGESTSLHEVRVYLYCQMSNHFHLLAETPRGNLNRFMHSILTGYTVYYNRRHRRHGHVTQGRYSAKLVSGDDYLLKLSRYVHLNPVRIKRLAGLGLEDQRERLRAYAWSSYPAYAGAARGPAWLVKKPLLELVGGRGPDQARRYREYVEAGIAQEDAEIQEALVRSAHCVGNEEYREYVEEKYDTAVKACRRREDAGFRQAVRPRVNPDVVLKAVAEAAGESVEGLKRRRRGTGVKAVAGWLLGHYTGMTQREIAPRLGMRAGATLSYHVNRLPQWVATAREVKRLLEKAESLIKQQMR